MWKKKVREMIEVKEVACDWSAFRTRELSTTSRKGFSGSSSVCTCKECTLSTQQPTTHHLLPAVPPLSVGTNQTWCWLHVR